MSANKNISLLPALPAFLAPTSTRAKRLHNITSHSKIHTKFGCKTRRLRTYRVTVCSGGGWTSWGQNNEASCTRGSQLSRFSENEWEWSFGNKQPKQWLFFCERGLFLKYLDNFLDFSKFRYLKILSIFKLFSSYFHVSSWFPAPICQHFKKNQRTLKQPATKSNKTTLFDTFDVTNWHHKPWSDTIFVQNGNGFLMVID